MTKKILTIVALLMVNTASNALSFTCTHRFATVTSDVDYKINNNLSNLDITIDFDDDIITTKSTYNYSGKTGVAERSYKIIKMYRDVLSAVSDETDGAIATLQLNLRTNYFASSFLLVTSAQASSGKCVKKMEQ
jgi:hypothetical protein